MAEKNDYYQTLGIQKSATDDDIKKAYRQMAKKYHPDANPGDAAAEAKFKEVSEAYSILSDPQKRAAYDQYGHAAFDPAQGGGGFTGGFGGFDAESIFESFFGGGFGDIFGTSGSRRAGPRRGADLQQNVQIKFEDAVFGCIRDITIQSYENCPTCKGSGAKPGTVAESCRQCGGTGQERVQQQTIFGTVTNVRTCAACRGEGKIIKDPCPDCRGAGRVRVQKTIQVNIPKGIDNGQSIRLTGRGEPGEKGGPSGDLLVTVYVQPHNRFVREGIHLFMDLPITFAQASLGDEIPIQTLEGEERLTIRPGTQPGTVSILKGKGVPNVKNPRVIGDLHVKLVVQVPTQLNEKQRQALREFAEAMGEEAEEKKGRWGKKK